MDRKHVANCGDANRGFPAPLAYCVRTHHGYLGRHLCISRQSRVGAPGRERRRGDNNADDHDDTGSNTSAAGDEHGRRDELRSIASLGA